MRSRHCVEYIKARNSIFYLELLQIGDWPQLDWFKNDPLLGRGTLGSARGRTLRPRRGPRRVPGGTSFHDLGQILAFEFYFVIQVSFADLTLFLISFCNSTAVQQQPAKRCLLTLTEEHIN